MSHSAFALRTIEQELPRFQYRFGSETELHDGICKVLDDNRLDYTREHIASAEDRFDIFCDGVVIEAKIHGSFNTAVRQCARYAKRDDVAAVVLVTSRHWARNPTLKRDAALSGKPFRVVHLRGMSF